MPRAALLAVLSFTVLVPALRAASITVDSLNDANGCSLRNAIIAANTNAPSGGCIAGAPGLDTITVTVDGTYAPVSPLPSLIEPVSISAGRKLTLDGSSAGAGASGIVLAPGSAGSTIDGMIIVRFAASGILVDSSENTISGNDVGVSGTTAAGNCTGGAGAGIYMHAQSGQILDGNRLLGNVIAGNACDGVRLEAAARSTDSGVTGTILTGNTIGARSVYITEYPNYQLFFIPNAGRGLAIINATGTQVDSLGGYSLIAKNLLGQVYVSVDAAAGAAAAPTLVRAVEIMGSGGSDVTPGIEVRGSTGPVELVRNAVGQCREGILVASSSSVSISSAAHCPGGTGLGRSGCGNVSGNEYGIVVRDSEYVTVGTTAPASLKMSFPPVVFGNRRNDLWLDGAQNCTISGRISEQPYSMSESTEPVVLISNSGTSEARNNTIFEAYIRGSNRTGIAITSGVGNRITNSFIDCEPPIDLGADGPTANDACDVDSGPNGFQNAPVIQSVVRVASNRVHVRGTFSSTIGDIFALDPHPPVGSTPLPQVNSSCDGEIDIIIPLRDYSSTVWTDDQVIAMAQAPYAPYRASITSSAYGTSELSAAVPIVEGQPYPRSDFVSGAGSTQNDIVWRNRTSGWNAVWSMDGFLVERVENVLPLEPASHRIAATCNLNSANADLLFVDATTGSVKIWFMAGTEPLGANALPTLPAGWTIAGSADVDRDGRNDLLLRNTTTGANAVWTIVEGALTKIIDLVPLPDPHWTLAGAADFDGDGFADLLWRHELSGANAVWVMDGAQVARIVDLPSISNTSIRIGGIADFDDGHPDIVWRNYENGANAVWRMKGLDLVEVVDLPAVADVTWEMVGPK